MPNLRMKNFRTYNIYLLGKCNIYLPLHMQYLPASPHDIITCLCTCNIYLPLHMQYLHASAHTIFTCLSTSVADPDPYPSVRGMGPDPAPELDLDPSPSKKVRKTLNPAFRLIFDFLSLKMMYMYLQKVISKKTLGSATVLSTCNTYCTCLCTCNIYLPLYTQYSHASTHAIFTCLCTCSIYLPLHM
jgi:hypothetical protein